jgi:hypothetical protein
MIAALLRALLHSNAYHDRPLRMHENASVSESELSRKIDSEQAFN